LEKLHAFIAICYFGLEPCLKCIQLALQHLIDGSGNVVPTGRNDAEEVERKAQYHPTQPRLTDTRNDNFTQDVSVYYDLAYDRALSRPDDAQLVCAHGYRIEPKPPDRIGYGTPPFAATRDSPQRDRCQRDRSSVGALHARLNDLER
jgi:hypothetical protein